MTDKISCVGYCILTRKEVPLALTNDGKIVCFLGGGIGQTTEHGVIITEDEIYHTKELSDKEWKWVFEKQKEFKKNLKKKI